MFEGESGSEIINKKFWKYIKSKKRDNCGVPTLVVNGKETDDSKGKADLLNKQYISVFSKERDYDPDLKGEASPEIGPLTFTEEDVRNLLSKIDPKKANGPDKFPNRVLKECSTSLAPYLTVIYDKSYNSGSIPDDWTRAKVIPAYKKGLRSSPINY